jgi:hypothetical protein
MFRVTSATALLAALAIVQLSWAQAQPANGYQRVITIQGPGNQRQECRVLRTWRERDGRIGYEVVALKTGERMTLFEGSEPTSDGEAGGPLSRFAARLFGNHMDGPDMVVDGIERRPQAPQPPLAAVASATPGINGQSTVTNSQSTATRSTNQQCVRSSSAAKPRPSSYAQLVIQEPSSDGWRSHQDNKAKSSQQPGKGTETATSSGGAQIIKASANPSAAFVAATPAGDWRQSWGNAEVSTHEESAPRLHPVNAALAADSAKKEGSPSDCAVSSERCPCPGASCEAPPPQGHSLLRRLHQAIHRDRNPSQNEDAPPELTAASGEGAVFDPTRPGAASIAMAKAAASASSMPADWDQVNAFTPAEALNRRKRQPLSAFEEPADGGSGSATTGNTAQSSLRRLAWLRSRKIQDSSQSLPGMINTQAVAQQNSMTSYSGTMAPAAGIPAGVAFSNVSTGMGLPGGPVPNAGGRDCAQLLAMLQDSPYPSHREWAADALSSVDGPLHPMIAAALIKGANQDPAATVRASCIRCLAKVSAGGPSVVAVLESLRTDPDRRVRDEASAALAVLGKTVADPLSTSNEAGGAILPAGN